MPQIALADERFKKVDADRFARKKGGEKNKEPKCKKDKTPLPPGLVNKKAKQDKSMGNKSNLFNKNKQRKQ